MELVKAKDLELVDCFSCLVGLVCNDVCPIFTCVLIVCIACCFELVKLIEHYYCAATPPTFKLIE